MKRFIVASGLFLVTLFIALPAFAEETDRVIVEVTNDKGQATIESMLSEDAVGKVLQPDYIRSISIQGSSVQTKSWGTKRIGAKRLQEQTASVEGIVIVALIDTGVDYTHPFLKDRIVSGFDVINGDRNPMDVQFHGTHVAGILADTTPENVKIMPIRALDEEGKGYDSTIAKGIHLAVDNGADVINMSFSGDEFSQYLSDAIDYALSKNVPIVVAAGNDSMDTKTLYPASEERAIVVSAVDQNDRIADFSNTGDSIDISAPGTTIMSSVPGDKFESFSGTSMAAPVISGVVAMMKLEEPSRTIEEIDLLLKKYADDRGAIGWDPIYGAGIVNISTYDEKHLVHSEPMKTTETVYIPFPEKRDVPLNAKWTIHFDRALTEGDKVDVKILRGDKVVPIALTYSNDHKEISVTSTRKLLPNTSYRLLLFVEYGKNYELGFETGR